MISRSLVVISTVLVLSAFQNCGRPSASVSSSPVTKVSAQPLSKFVSEMSVPVNGLTVHEDGHVADASGAPVPIDARLSLRIRETLQNAELCAYTHPPALPDTAYCMMYPMPYSQARTTGGESIGLAQPVCGVNTVDLCPATLSTLNEILKDLRDVL